MIDLNLNPTKKDLRVFGLILLAFLAIVGWIVWRRTGSALTASGLFAAGLLSAGLGWSVPSTLKPAFIALQVVSYPIGWTVSHIVMAIIYYVVVSPIGVIMRLSGRDPMERRFDRHARSYWKPRRSDVSSSRYFRQF